MHLKWKCSDCQLYEGNPPSPYSSRSYLFVAVIIQVIRDIGIHWPHTEIDLAAIGLSKS